MIKALLPWMTLTAALASAFGIMMMARSGAVLSTPEGKRSARRIWVGIVLSWGSLALLYGLLSLVG